MSRYGLISLSTIGIAILVTAALLAAHQVEAEAHCQVPCGIYDDAARIKHMKEDAATIAKAIANINDLAGKQDAQAFNQAARWVVTKEAHASDIISTVSEYFLTQKVKPVVPGADGYEAYLKKLADHHAVMVAAMKTKQSADPATVATLDKAIDTLAIHY
jgi:nickel superoxide dismutase